MNISVNNSFQHIELLQITKNKLIFSRQMILCVVGVLFLSITFIYYMK